MGITPINSKILVRPIRIADRNGGGLYLPKAYLPEPMEGDIIAVGERTDLQIGDRVVYQRHLGNYIEYMGEELIIMEDAHVYGVV